MYLNVQTEKKSENVKRSIVYFGGKTSVDKSCNIMNNIFEEIINKHNK